MKRIMKTILKMGMLALISFMVLPTVAQTQMMVLSDTHVMSKKLIVKDGTAWQTALSNERKLLDYSQEIFDALMDTVMQRNPQLLLITGDLTKDGELLSHQHVVEGLEKLRQAGIKTYVIPGNHDLGNNNAKVFDGDISYKAKVVDAEMFAQMYAHFGYDEHSLRESTSLTYACEPIKGLVLIGIDSGTNGSLSETTLNWVCQQAQKAKEQGKQVIAIMHHALVPHFVGVEKIVNSAFVKDYEQIRNRLADSGIRVIFTGHFHSSDIAKDFNFKSPHTVRNYIAYLKQAYMLIGIKKYSPKSKSRITQEKVYAVDVALMNQRENAFAGENLGWRLENIVMNHLIRKCQFEGWDVYYLKDRSGECDFVICNGSKVLQCIQVSYDITSEKTRKRELNGLLLAARQTKCENLLLLTDHETEEVKQDYHTIRIQPVYEWCVEIGL